MGWVEDKWLGVGERIAPNRSRPAKEKNYHRGDGGRSAEFAEKRAQEHSQEWLCHSRAADPSRESLRVKSRPSRSCCRVWLQGLDEVEKGAEGYSRGAFG